MKDDVQYQSKCPPRNLQESGKYTYDDYNFRVLDPRVDSCLSAFGTKCYGKYRPSKRRRITVIPSQTLGSKQRKRGSHNPKNVNSFSYKPAKVYTLNPPKVQKDFRATTRTIGCASPQEVEVTCVHVPASLIKLYPKPYNFWVPL